MAGSHPDRVTIVLAALAETAREGLLALSVCVGLVVVGEIFEGRTDPAS